ncbi:MAG: LppU/SCO3897 family protein [Propionibacteriaceae bacterium]
MGDCITVSTTGADTKGACSTGSYKVTLTKDGTSDDTECPAESTTSIPNATRNKLICLAKQK